MDVRQQVVLRAIALLDCGEAIGAKEATEFGHCLSSSACCIMCAALLGRTEALKGAHGLIKPVFLNL